ncbi:lytic transglycosylase domain-containing protein [Stenotrophomonas sp. CFBP 13718]|nr:lytic transglycosylase domain-containing protein [Stenotrophomonas sp. CFBP 13718]MBD8697305.1 lytic transglycosylase domain-containing protein [Stenotrophomonas sp. CFBP 13718]
MHRSVIQAALASSIALGASASSVQAASIYAGLSADGRLVVAEQPALGLRFFDASAPRRAANLPHAPASAATRWRPLIQQVADEVGIDVALLQAVVSQESSFNPRAVSPAGAVGLMQLMPGTARRFGVRDRFDPAQNLRGGARYLVWLLDHFNQDLDLALAAYNAGEGSVRRHGNRVPPFAETRAYVHAVRQRYAY